MTSRLIKRYLIQKAHLNPPLNQSRTEIHKGQSICKPKTVNKRISVHKWKSIIQVRSTLPIPSYRLPSSPGPANKPSTRSRRRHATYTDAVWTLTSMKKLSLLILLHPRRRNAIFSKKAQVRKNKRRRSKSRKSISRIWSKHYVCPPLQTYPRKRNLIEKQREDQ